MSDIVYKNVNQIVKKMGALLPLGTMTKWGRVGAVGLTRGERYYWLVSENGTVSMMPADVVEEKC